MKGTSVYLPEFGTNLVATLPTLDMQNFSHAGAPLWIIWVKKNMNVDEEEVWSSGSFIWRFKLGENCELDWGEERTHEKGEVCFTWLQL